MNVYKVIGTVGVPIRNDLNQIDWDLVEEDVELMITASSITHDARAFNAFYKKAISVEVEFLTKA